MDNVARMSAIVVWRDRAEMDGIEAWARWRRGRRRPRWARAVKSKASGEVEAAC